MEDKNAMVECESYDYLFEIGSRDREKQVSFHVVSSGIKKKEALELSSYMENMKDEIKRILAGESRQE